MKDLEGEHTPESRKGRVRLSVRDPFIETALAGFNLDGFNIDATRSWGNSKLAEARLFLLGKPAESQHRLSQRDADRLWVMAGFNAGRKEGGK